MSIKSFTEIKNELNEILNEHSVTATISPYRVGPIGIYFDCSNKNDYEKVVRAFKNANLIHKEANYDGDWFRLSNCLYYPNREIKKYKDIAGDVLRVFKKNNIPTAIYSENTASGNHRFKWGRKIQLDNVVLELKSLGLDVSTSSSLYYRAPASTLTIKNHSSIANVDARNSLILNPYGV